MVKVFKDDLEKLIEEIYGGKKLVFLVKDWLFRLFKIWNVY